MSAVARGFVAAHGAGALLRPLASPRVTLAGFGVLFAAALVAGYTEMPAAWPLAAPLLLLAANLAAAILVNPAFRAQGPLLAFHLALLALVLLAAAGRLTYLKGRLELSSGEAFAGELTNAEAGPWHPWHLGDAAFSNEGFHVAYSAGRNRDETRNLVRWEDAAGPREATIGDQRPLERAGYRFYPSSNKGFAPIVTWQAAGDEPRQGSVHLPSYPLYDYAQSQSWTPPGARGALWLMLEFDEVIVDPARSSEFRLPRSHALVVRDGARRATLAPGEAVDVAGGRLRYDALTTWMGYDVHYDRTMPWMLLAAACAVAALGWHFARRFRREPWDA